MAKTTSSSIPTAEQYESHEQQLAYRHIADVANAPLSERKENQARWANALLTPELIAQRIGWLLNGDYGKGAQLMALRVIESPRMNQVAALSQLIACFEWRCDSDRARLAWKKLPKANQRIVDGAIKQAIEAYKVEK
jgi:hypothetical protein